MKRKKSKHLSRISMATDFLLVFLSGVISMFVRFGLEWEQVDYRAYLVSFAFVAFTDMMVLYFNRSYELMYKSLTVEIPRLVKALMYSFVIFLIISFFIRSVSFSRLSYAYFGIIAIFLQTAGKFMFHNIRKMLYVRGHDVRHVLFIGFNAKCAEITEYLTSHPEYGFRMEGYVDSIGDTGKHGHNKTRGDQPQEPAIKCLGKIDNFESVVRKYDITTVIICMENRLKMEAMISFCETNYIQVLIIPDILDLTAASIEAGQINDIPMLVVRENLLSPIQWKVKRMFDILVSLFALVITLPLFGIISAAVKLTSKGPVFFKHRRLGHNNEIIYVYKFRTMVDNAEAELKRLFKKRPELMEEFERDYKLKDDPRITPLGRFLRKTSLDELPQIINILRGEMSWVGPRPIVEKEISRYGEYAKIILRVPPGITGYWQTNGRNDLDYDERIKLDIYYINNWSFLLDIMIILRTIPVVLKRKGAY